MASKRLDRVRFAPLVLEAVKKFDQSKQGQSPKLFADLTNQRDDFAEWFAKETGVKVSGKYHHEKILAPFKNNNSGQSYLETPVSENLLKGYIQMGADSTDQHLSDYLFKESTPSSGRFIAAALGILLVSTVLLLFFLPVGEWQKAQSSPELRAQTEQMGQLHALQFVLMLLFMGATLFMQRNHLKKIPRNGSLLQKKTFSQLFLGLQGVWGSFCLLYLWLALSSFFFPDFPLTEAVSDVLNACGSAFFFYLFLVMDQESFPPQDHPGSLRKFRVFLGWGLIFMAVLVSLSLLDRALPLGKGDSIFTVIYSFIMAVPYIYFFGRLDSHNFQANRLALAPLYLYGIIQSIWTDLLSEPIQSLVFVSALLLKIYFFAFVWFHLREGNFAAYFRKMHEIYRK